MERQRRTINFILASACLVLGAMVCAWLIGTKPKPPKRSVFGRELEVAVTEVVPTAEASPVVGHGTVRAKNQVKIVPQVSGALVHVHEDLAVGKLIPEGELLFEIEPGMYEARVRQAAAEVNRLEGALVRSDEELASLDIRIANVEEMLRIDEQDYLTSKRLYEEENVGTARDVDLVNQKLLRQKDALIELRSRRSLIPHVKLETEALLEAARARLKQHEINLENTKIYCPFEARVELVSAYQSQVVTAHFSIATLTDMSAFEISVGVDPRDLRWLDEAIRPETLREARTGPSPEVTVRWSLHGQELAWRGYVTRFERVDEATRTARLVVEVRHVDMAAKLSADHGEGPSVLAIGMHCRAELPAQQLAGAVLVPRHAVYDNRWVYVFERDEDVQTNEDGHPIGRLGRREVPVLRSVGDSVLVDYAGRGGPEACELQPGELVVVSPLVKPVLGMKIRLENEGQAIALTAGTSKTKRHPHGSSDATEIEPSVPGVAAADRASGSILGQSYSGRGDG